MRAGRRIEHLLQFGRQRYEQLRSRLLLLNVDFRSVRPEANVLRPHADYVAAPLHRFQREGEREPLTRTDGIARLELRYFILSPCVVASRLVRWQLDTERRIIIAEALGRCEVEQAA